MFYDVTPSMHQEKMPAHASWFLRFVVTQWTVISSTAFTTGKRTPRRISAPIDIQHLGTAQDRYVHSILQTI